MAVKKMNLYAYVDTKNPEDLQHCISTKMTEVTIICVFVLFPPYHRDTKRHTLPMTSSPLAQMLSACKADLVWSPTFVLIT